MIVGFIAISGYGLIIGYNQNKVKLQTLMQKIVIMTLNNNLFLHTKKNLKRILNSILPDFVAFKNQWVNRFFGSHRNAVKRHTGTWKNTTQERG